MSAHSEMDRFVWEMEKLMRKHNVAPAILLFHPPNTYSNVGAVAVIGNPSLEWCVGMGEEYARKLDDLIKEKKITSPRQIIPPNMGDKLTYEPTAN